MTIRRSAMLLAALFFNVGASANEPGTILWSLKPVVRPTVPSVERVTHPIDAFLVRSLQSQGLQPAPEADRRTFIRRLTFDLTGLPPTPEETNAFLNDDRPDAYGRLVDRLLTSPQYGERWARHWLDLVRYAETHGYERDDPKPNAWKYRDWVISALNRDLPYDQFVIQQLAGDEVDEPTNDSKTATGMYRLGPIDDEPADVLADRFDQLDDMVKTIGTTMLGLSIHCARCHDHKFDPIKQTDYYRMVAFLTPSKPYVRGQDESISLILADESERRRVAEMTAVLDRQIAEKSARMEAIVEPHRKAVAMMPGDANALALARLAPEESRLRSQIEAEIGQLQQSKPTGLSMTLGLTDVGADSAPTHLMIRGDAHRPGAVVEPGFLSAIEDRSASFTPPAATKSTGRRLALARWIVRPDHPLTARVMVNRIWQGHFGQGIVATPSDFGLMGDEPSHPELLDWLASEFVAQGWSMKALHRLILTSAAYRRAGVWNEKAAEIDPANASLWRFTPRRLEAEPIRDAILAVSGALNLEMGGPSIMPEIDVAVLAGQSRPGSGWNVSKASEASRRSVYVHAKRTLGVPELELLDAADKNEPCPKRAVTTTAPQALTLMNGKFMHEQAASFADRLRKEAGEDPRLQVERAFWLSFNRPANSVEIDDSLAFLQDQAKRVEARPDARNREQPAKQALQAFCLVILNANEFVMID